MGTSTADAAPPARRPRIAAIILNYRTPGLTIDCVRSLAPQRDDWPELEVLIVDNASGDGSAAQFASEIAARGWSSWARVVESPENRGFSAGNNFGIKAADADVYWLLNSDTLMLPGVVAELGRALLARPDAGLICPRLEWPDGSARQNCFRFARPLTEMVQAAGTGPVSRVLHRYVPAMPVPEVSIEPDWTCFASVMIRRWVFDRIGLLDDGYFMYYEDIDFCRRAKQAGIATVFWPTARMIHLEGESSSVTKVDNPRRRRPAYYYAARARYYAKFHGRFGLWTANVCWGIGRSIAWVRELVGNKPQHAREREGRDIWTNWRNPLAPWPIGNG